MHLRRIGSYIDYFQLFDNQDDYQFSYPYVFLLYNVMSFFYVRTSVNMSIRLKGWGDV